MFLFFLFSLVNRCMCMCKLVIRMSMTLMAFVAFTWNIYQPSLVSECVAQLVHGHGLREDTWYQFSFTAVVIFISYLVSFG